jgi:DNA-directed RNA polymerase subunit RPC12/RpoP
MIYLDRLGEKIELLLPPSESFAFSKEDKVCLDCGKPLDNILAKHAVEYDFTIEADARCGYCNSTIGRVVLERDTLFGHSEDTRIKCGPWKIF